MNKKFLTHPNYLSFLSYKANRYLNPFKLKMRLHFHAHFIFAWFHVQLRPLRRGILAIGH